MAEQEEQEQEQQLPSDDHVPLNEGAVGKILQIMFHLKSRMALIKERFQNSVFDYEYFLSEIFWHERSTLSHRRSHWETLSPH